MKIAVATEGNRVAAHFGHCREFTLAEVIDGVVKNREVVANPEHQPGFLPRYLGSMGVTHVIAGGMGPRAQELFATQGITTVIGVQGTVEEALQALANGTLVGGPSLCTHGNQGHGSTHHCEHRGCGGEQR